MLISYIQRTNWICWRFAINLPKEIGYSPLLTRVLAFSVEFCKEEAEFIWASKWASLSRKGAVETLTCEVECLLQMRVVSIKQPKHVSSHIQLSR
jgi:hypothetical protein